MVYAWTSCTKHQTLGYDWVHDCKLFKTSNKGFKEHYRRTSKRKLMEILDTMKLHEKYLLCEKAAALEENKRTGTKRQNVNLVVNKNHLRCEARKIHSYFLVVVEPWIALQVTILPRHQPHLWSRGLPDALDPSKIQSSLKICEVTLQLTVALH